MAHGSPPLLWPLSMFVATAAETYIALSCLLPPPSVVVVDVAGDCMSFTHSPAMTPNFQFEFAYAFDFEVPTRSVPSKPPFCGFLKKCNFFD